MALPTLTITDFVGSLLVNYQTERFSQYINEDYDSIVQDCIGEDAYADVLATDAQKWTDLFSGIVYDHVGNKKKAVLKGLTSAVKYFIWSEFVNDNFVPTNAGMKKPLAENSMRVLDLSNARLVQNRYNEGVMSMCNLLRFVDNYKDFEQPIDGFINNGGGSFTINASKTLYLADGDTVAIDGIDYVISNVVDNTSFDITSTDVDSFEGVYISNPYECVEVGRLKAMI